MRDLNALTLSYIDYIGQIIIATWKLDITCVKLALPLINLRRQEDL